MGTRKRKLTSSRLPIDPGNGRLKTKRNMKKAAKRSSKAVKKTNKSAKHSSRNSEEAVKVNSYTGWVPRLIDGKAEGVAALGEPSQLEAQHFWRAHIAVRRPALIPSTLANNLSRLLAMDSWSVEKLKKIAVRPTSPAYDFRI